jgi:lipid-A-disaccharide synthase
MTPGAIMVVAGDPSGDANAADLVKTLAASFPAARFIGAGGPKMAGAGVELSFNLTDDSAIGPTDALKNIGSFLRRKRDLVNLARERRPELVILVDSYSFTQPVARGIRKAAPAGPTGWEPKIVRYTSPQVWASRPGRAETMARDIDLLLCLFPFEKDWYARRGTNLRVEFVGHPMFDRYPRPPANAAEPATPTIVLLPGSRADELKRHLPVMIAAAKTLAAKGPVAIRIVAVNEKMAGFIRSLAAPALPNAVVQTGQLAEALSGATIAITKTGTITMECAYFGVPTVAMYKASPLFYRMARPFVTVKYLSMPNLLADEVVFPEFVQDQATAENIATAAGELLASPERRAAMRAKLRQIIDTLGGPGATARAADCIRQLL